MMEVRRRYVETTANRHVVSVDMERSHAATHLAEQDGLWELTQEAVRKIEVTSPDQRIQVNMGRVVGRMDLVEVKPDEKIIYGRRRNRESMFPLWNAMNVRLHNSSFWF